MAQNPADKKQTPSAKSLAPAATQARLILQDPMAFDQATQPALRSSMELAVEPAASAMEREKARDLWESISLEPEAAQERQSERKRLLLRSDNLARETAAVKVQAIELQAQLVKARDERLEHPLVYAGAAGLLGLGTLWWLERRKRLILQERELEILAQQTPNLDAEEPQAYLKHQGSTFSLEDSPDLADDFATDLRGLPDHEPLPMMELLEPATAPEPLVPPKLASTPQTNQRLKDVLPGLEQKPVASNPATPDWALPKSDVSQADDILEDAPWKTHDKGWFSASKRVLGNMLRRRSPRDALGAMSSTHRQSEIQSSSHSGYVASSTMSHERMDDTTQMLYDEEAQEAFEQEMLAQQLSSGLHAENSPDQANIDLLSSTRATPYRGESAMEHLLELRTAINGLRALGRPESAAKLLAEHIEVNPDTCAWAYLEFMHLSELIGWREQFETMRQGYRQQFNRMAPYWHEPNSNVLGLDGYARAAGELCAAWVLGISHVHNTLASWLVGPLLGRKLVQLPAYHDLFDLYEMLEFIDTPIESALANAPSRATLTKVSPSADFLNLDALPVLTVAPEDEQEFVPTVSLLELDYEFSSDVILEESEVQQSEKAVTIVKTGNFSVDFNVAGTQLGGISSFPADLAKK